MKLQPKNGTFVCFFLHFSLSFFFISFFLSFFFLSSSLSFFLSFFLLSFFLSFFLPFFRSIFLFSFFLSFLSFLFVVVVLFCSLWNRSFVLFFLDLRCNFTVHFHVLQIFLNMWFLFTYLKMRILQSRQHNFITYYLYQYSILLLNKELLRSLSFNGFWQ